MPHITEMIPKDMPEWAKDAIEDGQFFNVAAKAMNELDVLRAAMRDIYEVWAGSDAFHAETCSEDYQQRLIKEMTDIAAAHLTIPE